MQGNGSSNGEPDDQDEPGGKTRQTPAELRR
jgi:hypothetical protein